VKKSSFVIQKHRLYVVYLILFGLIAVIENRLFTLQILEHDFLQEEADNRHVRTVQIPTTRGVITDRNHELLAVSLPVNTIWANPKEVQIDIAELSSLANIIDVDVNSLMNRLINNSTREFLYLRRQLTPEDSAEVMRLGISGVYSMREYKRFYPEGESVAHLIGFTNIDDEGQEGLELAYESWLGSTPGRKQVVRDRFGRIIEDIRSVDEPIEGNDLQITIDLRLQYRAYQELKRAVFEHSATSGSIVVIDVDSGDVLALANQPYFNPNNRASFSPRDYRNRAISDVFEPGSAMKPFIVAAAVESGIYDELSIVDTSPGSLLINGRIITSDYSNYGSINLRTILENSSNVGASKVALSLDREFLYQTLNSFGFGSSLGSGLPGEASGVMTTPENWATVNQATMAYGYGLSVTTLQLAQAYTILAAGGVRRPLSFIRNESIPSGTRIISEENAEKVNLMLESVVNNGTGGNAAVDNYRVGGKTGTAWKANSGGYSETNYIATFAGFAPVSKPKFVIIVVIDDPKNSEYYGGSVAAPVFSNVMSEALRIYGIEPDNLGINESDFLLARLDNANE
jgi:cell division protein FtsI (penicillin-binding protein 3)